MLFKQIFALEMSDWLFFLVYDEKLSVWNIFFQKILILIFMFIDFFAKSILSKDFGIFFSKRTPLGLIRLTLFYMGF